jgi:glycosyltransferase involved in cell wall biosynthesis
MISNFKKTIAIVSSYLCDYDMPQNGFIIGGAQRYCIDLSKLFYSIGYKTVFVTKAKFNTEIIINDYSKMVAIKSPKGSTGDIKYSKEVFKLLNKIKPEIACYSEMQIAFPYCYENSFALQHGIYWDNPNYKLKSKFIIYRTLYAMRKLKKVICVDTNFINWCREQSKEYFSNPSKLIYIPNYADEEQFKYNYIEWDDSKPFNLLFPRRMDPRRGYDLFMNMCRTLKKKGYNIVPVLAFEEYNDKAFKDRYPDYNDLGCVVVHPKMNEIQELYNCAFLTYVPTIWSEGTSLSAIESMSRGTPVIASDVGGLGNVIFQGYNGYITAPTVNNFISITEQLINNIDKRNELSRNCAFMNKIFGKKRWEEQVVNAIGDMVDE